MRLYSFALLATMLLGPSIARADLIYTITLTSIDGNAGGSGSLDLSVAPPSSGTVTYGFPGGRVYTPGDTVDAFTLTYIPPPGGRPTVNSVDPIDLGFVQFTDGAISFLSGFVFYGGTASCQSQLGVGPTTYGYNEDCFINGGYPMEYADSGVVTFTPELATTPEPSSVALLATGLLSVAGLVRKRYRRA